MNEEAHRALTNNALSNYWTYMGARLFGKRKDIEDGDSDVVVLAYWRGKPFFIDYRLKRSKPQGQSKKASMVEACINISVGIGVAFSANMIVLPLYGYNLTTQDNLGITAIFTAISFIRSYSLRRIFNRIHTKNGWTKT